MTKKKDREQDYLEAEQELERDHELGLTQEEEPVPEEPVVTPLAASPSFYLTVNMTYSAGATQIGQAQTYQLVTPWGQSTACINLLDAFNQMVAAGSAYSGQMWNYLANGVTRGLTTTSATVPVSATPFQQPP